MKGFRQVATLNPPHVGQDGERFAVLEIDPTQRIGDGCRAIIISFHHDRAKAEQEMHA